VDVLGIIAGGGELPLAVAESVQQSGREVFVVGLRGWADPAVGRYSHEWVSLGETGKLIETLRAHRCKDILLCGRVARPRFSDLKLDAKSIVLLPKLLAAARRGDDALLKYVVDLLEKEGFRAIGVGEAAPGLLAREGVLGHIAPSAENLNDIAVGARLVRRLGELDVGQAAVVCAGLVLAVEAAEGTDAMIARIADLPETIRGTPSARKGVLVKALKPQQDGKTDLPVIGVETVARVKTAGLAGIAVEAGKSLVVDAPAVVRATDDAGLFLVGFSHGAYAD
jgi:UDP-2,3-diacylglucosamine hydrolase